MYLYLESDPDSISQYFTTHFAVCNYIYVISAMHIIITAEYYVLTYGTK